MTLKELKKYSDENKGYIYIIINKINGKKYVGQTNNPYRRWIEHRSNISKNSSVKSYLRNAMIKYGKENFVFEVIEIVELNIVSEREQYWIKEFNTLVPNGYNLTKGGEALYGTDNPFYGKKHTEETKNRISKKNKGRVQTEEERAHRRVINAGERNPFYHKKHTEDSIQRMVEKNKQNGNYKLQSEKMKGNKFYLLHKYRKVKMKDKDTDEVIFIFENVIAAAEYVKKNIGCITNHPNNSIVACCNKHQNTAYGYKWEYIEKDEKE